jgi:hypothetical protein
MFLKLVEHKLEMGLMVSDYFAEHKYVVEVNMDKYTNVSLEAGIHQPLKGGRCIAVTLLHN